MRVPSPQESNGFFSHTSYQVVLVHDLIVIDVFRFSLAKVVVALGATA
jgi:hypothetical protein